VRRGTSLAAHAQRDGPTHQHALASPAHHALMTAMASPRVSKELAERWEATWHGHQSPREEGERWHRLLRGEEKIF
jgi:hypothetical protein